MGGYFTDEQIAAMGGAPAVPSPTGPVAGPASVDVAAPHSLSESIADRVESAQRMGRFVLQNPLVASASEGLGALVHRGMSALHQSPSAPAQTTAQMTQPAIGIGPFTRPLPTVNVHDLPDAPVTLPALASPNVGGQYGTGPSVSMAGYRAAQQGMDDAVGREAAATGQLGVARADALDRGAERGEEEARLMAQRDAEVMQIHKESNAAVDDMFAQNARDISAVGEAKVDRRRLFRNQTAGETIAIGVGAALGGWLRGFQGKDANTFLDHIDRMVDKDVSDQIQDVENKKSAMSARMNMYAHLVQQTGSRQIAAMKLRDMQLETVKTQTIAEAKRNGVPEELAKADVAVAGITQKQMALREQWAKEMYQQEIAQRSAAVAAQRNMEKEAFERAMKIEGLRIENRKVDVDELKAGHEREKEINAQVQTLGKELADPKLAEGRMVVDEVKRTLSKVGPQEGVPGVGRGGDFRAKLRPEGANVLVPQAHIMNAVAGLSDEERVNRQNWAQMELAFRTRITGQGGGEKELAVIKQAFGGAKTPAEQRNAVAIADSIAKQVEARFMASVPPEAKARYLAHMKGQAAADGGPKGDGR